MTLYWPTCEALGSPYFGPDLPSGKTVRRTGKVWVAACYLYDIWKLCEASAALARPVLVAEQGRVSFVFIAERHAIWLREAHENDVLLQLSAQVMPVRAGSWLAGVDEVARASPSTRVGL
jgi:hypothetical protein